MSIAPVFNLMSAQLLRNLERDAKWLDEIARRNSDPEEAGGAAQVADLAVAQSCLLADVAPRAREWIWPGLAAVGHVTLVLGEPGAGKSLLMAEVAARASSGRPLPALADPRREAPGETEDAGMGGRGDADPLRGCPARGRGEKPSASPLTTHNSPLTPPDSGACDVLLVTRQVAGHRLDRPVAR